MTNAPHGEPSGAGARGLPTGSDPSHIQTEQELATKYERLKDGYPGQWVAVGEGQSAFSLATPDSEIGPYTLIHGRSIVSGRSSVKEGAAVLDSILTRGSEMSGNSRLIRSFLVDSKLLHDATVMDYQYEALNDDGSNSISRPSSLVGSMITEAARCVGSTLTFVEMMSDSFISDSDAYDCVLAGNSHVDAKSMIQGYNSGVDVDGNPVTPSLTDVLLSNGTITMV